MDDGQAQAESKQKHVERATDVCAVCVIRERLVSVHSVCVCVCVCACVWSESGWCLYTVCVCVCVCVCVIRERLMSVQCVWSESGWCLYTVCVCVCVCVWSESDWCLCSVWDQRAAGVCTVCVCVIRERLVSVQFVYVCVCVWSEELQLHEARRGDAHPHKHKPLCVYSISSYSHFHGRLSVNLRESDTCKSTVTNNYNWLF